VAISHFIGQILLDYGVAANQVSVVRSAVDPLPYQKLERNACGQKWRHRFQIPDQTLLLGSASALSPQKGPDILLQSLAQLHQNSNSSSVPQWHCLIAGEGDMRPQLEQMVRDLDLNSRVTLTGFVREIPELLSAFDVLLLPSRNEGLGTLVQEAMLAGTPVIASAVGGIPEMVHPGETGLLVPPEDPEALGQAIQDIVTNEKLRGQLVTAARQLIDAEFSLNSMVEGNLKVYRSVLTATRAGD
jgi:glycosyltransferase involved in cell wall biosynthesis